MSNYGTLYWIKFNFLLAISAIVRVTVRVCKAQYKLKFTQTAYHEFQSIQFII